MCRRTRRICRNESMYRLINLYDVSARQILRCVASQLAQNDKLPRTARKVMKRSNNYEKAKSRNLAAALRCCFSE